MPDPDYEGDAGAFRVGLQTSPAVVALDASQMTNAFPMTETAAVYLAAVMDFINVKELERTGNVALNSVSCPVISC